MSREALYQQIAKIGHAVSNPHRLRLVSMLGQSEKTVEVLASLLGESVAATSAHLKVLRLACLVEGRKQGRHVHYRLSHPDVGLFLLTLRALGERVLPEAREIARAFVEDKESLVALTHRELIEEVWAGRVTLIDLRPEYEYSTAHLPGAISVPAARLDEWLTSVSKEERIVAYCRGPYCLAGLRGVERMRQQGFNAKRLPDGVLEWQAAGLSLEPAAASQPSSTH